MTNTHEFIKLGKTIVPKPAGSDYSLEAGRVYDLKWIEWVGAQLTINGDLNLPKKIYQTEKDKSFINRVLTYHKNTTSNTTGVMLAGIKGTGKTITAKLIAKQSNLPIIVIDSRFPAAQLTNFFKQFTQDVCILVDEADKNYRTNDMLGFLDGVEKTCKKLVVFTCNEMSNVSEYFLNRCSRVRYLRTYRADSNLDYLPIILKDLNIKNEKEVYEFCKKEIKLLSLDNIFAFLQEVKELEGTTSNLGQIISIMNIDTRTNFSKHEEPDEEESDEDAEQEIKNTNEKIEREGLVLEELEYGPETNDISYDEMSDEDIFGREEEQAAA